MKISVAMCTYNGEKYLNEQINSILSQTILPDEIIICDDGSTDNTINIIKNINSPIIKLHQNPINLGTTKNFEQTIKMCSGDIIFLADQDDVWVPNKVATIIAAFDNSPKAYMVFTDAYLTDDNLDLVDCSLWESLEFDYNNFSSYMLIEKSVATGATMAIKQEALEFIFPFFGDRFHDEWIAFMLTFLGHTTLINEKLIYYRQHKNQQSGGIRKAKRYNKFIEIRIKLLGVSLRHHIRNWTRLKKCQEHLRLFPINESYLELNDYVDHLNVRFNLPKNKMSRWKAIYKEFPRYLKYDMKITAFRDLLNL